MPWCQSYSTGKFSRSFEQRLILGFNSLHYHVENVHILSDNDAVGYSEATATAINRFRVEHAVFPPSQPIDLWLRMEAESQILFVVLCLEAELKVCELRDHYALSGANFNDDDDAFVQIVPTLPLFNAFTMMRCLYTNAIDLVTLCNQMTRTLGTLLAMQLFEVLCAAFLNNEEGVCLEIEFNY